MVGQPSYCKEFHLRINGFRMVREIGVKILTPISLIIGDKYF